MIPPVLVEAPAELPIAVEEAKALSPMLASLSDDVVAALLGAATAQLDGPFGLLKRCIVTQTWQQSFDRPQARYTLPRFGGVQVSSVYAGEDLVDEGGFVVGTDASGTYVRSGRPITRVVFEAGFGGADAVPENVKVAIVMIASDIGKQMSTRGTLRSFEVADAFTETYSSPEILSQATRNIVASLLGRLKGLTVA